MSGRYLRCLSTFGDISDLGQSPEEKSHSELNVTLVDNKKEPSGRSALTAYSGWPGHFKCVSDHHFKLEDIPLAIHSSQESKVTSGCQREKKNMDNSISTSYPVTTQWYTLNNLFLIIPKVPKCVRKFTGKHCIIMAQGCSYTSPSLACIQFVSFNGEEKDLTTQVLPWRIALNPRLQIHQSSTFSVVMESRLKSSAL